jgi:F0F1-type ATP synthase assembly protein I
MDNLEEECLAYYIASGIAIGALVGILISIFVALILHSMFLAVSGTGFGICAGVLVANIISCLKNKVN